MPLHKQCNRNKNLSLSHLQAQLLPFVPLCTYSSCQTGSQKKVAVRPCCPEHSRRFVMKGHRFVKIYQTYCSAVYCDPCLASVMQVTDVSSQISKMLLPQDTSCILYDVFSYFTLHIYLPTGYGCPMNPSNHYAVISNS